MRKKPTGKQVVNGSQPEGEGREEELAMCFVVRVQESRQVLQWRPRGQSPGMRQKGRSGPRKSVGKLRV